MKIGQYRALQDITILLYGFFLGCLFGLALLLEEFG